jgi:hypothetical protein
MLRAIVCEGRDQMHMVRQLPATTGMWLTFARTNIAEFLIAAFQVPFARPHRVAFMIERASPNWEKHPLEPSVSDCRFCSRTVFVLAQYCRDVWRRRQKIHL